MSPLLGAAASLLLPLVATAAPCRDAAGCGLNGDCSPDERRSGCVCDPGWAGENCCVLDLAPAPTQARQAYMVNTSSWGGNVIKDPVTGAYHLFFSEMRTGGLHSYSSPGHCQLTTAVSLTSPTGPFDLNRTVLRSSAVGGPYQGRITHNVQPQMGPDGAVYIFMITSPPPPPPGPPPAPDPESKPRKAPKNLTVLVGRAPRLGASFEFVEPLLLQQNGSAVLKDNPTAIIFGNGTVLMVTRGTSLFKAASWRGPYRMENPSILGCEYADPSLGGCREEDPFFWQSPRGFHLLFHNHEPFAYHKQVLAYAFTTDRSAVNGWEFSYVEAGNGTDIQFDDGTVHTFCSRQRPQLFFSEVAGADGVQRGRPLVLFTGAQHGFNTDNTSLCGATAGIRDPVELRNNYYDDYSFTFAQPFKSR